MQAMNTRGGGEGVELYLRLFSTEGLDESELSASRPRRSVPGGEGGAEDSGIH